MNWKENADIYFNNNKKKIFHFVEPKTYNHSVKPPRAVCCQHESIRQVS